MTLFVNIIIPKAGIKIAGVPITLGSILYAILFIWYLFKIKIKSKQPKIYILFFIYLFYIFIRSLISLLLGWNLTDFITYLSSLFIYPLIFFVINRIVLDDNQINKIFKTIFVGTNIILFYALLQQLFGIENVCIPGITVNLSDYMENGKFWYLQKSNGYLDSSKIISTYQNGNLFGVNLLMFMPISWFYANKQKSLKLYKYVFLLLFTLIGFLTLSRTVWIGVILFLVFVYLKMKTRTKTQLIVKILLPICGAVALVILSLKVDSLNARLGQFFSSDILKLGGRSEILNTFIDSVKDNSWFSLFSIIGLQGFLDYSILVYEMNYVTIFILYGIIGLVLFLIVTISILNKAKHSNLNLFIYFGIVLWLVVAFIDGCLWLPPTSFNLFSLLGLVYKVTNISKENK